MAKSVYLAGPEVFLSNAREMLDKKIALTREAGLIPISPGDLEIPKMLRLELSVKSDRDTTGLSGSGLIVVNPPYTLKGEMDALLPFLRTTLAQDQAASFVNEWIRPEA